MKVTQDQTFQPISITLETREEASNMIELLNDVLSTKAPFSYREFAAMLKQEILREAVL